MFRDFTSVTQCIRDSNAWNNAAFVKFESGLDLENLRFISREYLFFTEAFPDILGKLIGRVDGGMKFWLVQIIYSELGTGKEAESHSRLFQRLCGDVGLVKHQLVGGPALASTRKFLKDLASLYEHGDIWRAIGCQYALEFQADNMLRQLRKAYRILDQHNSSRSDGMYFFDIHEKEEPGHIAAMENVIAKGLKTFEDYTLMESGVDDCIRLFAMFWNGVSEEMDRVGAR